MAGCFGSHTTAGAARARRSGIGISRSSTRSAPSRFTTSPAIACASHRKGTGTTLAAYIRRARATVAHTLLLETAKSIPDVAFEAGFGSLSQFYDVMKREIGIAPGELRKSTMSAARESTPSLRPVDRFEPPSVPVPPLEDRWV